MEVALGIVIAMNAAILSAVVYHLGQCARFHERVAKLEQWKEEQERK